VNKAETTCRPLKMEKPKTSDTDKFESLTSSSIVVIFRFLTVTSVSAFFTCILLSMKNNWDQSTATHCNVPNYLPSISAAIGGYSPQKYIWRIAIALQLSPRLLFAYIYYRHNLAQPFQNVDHVLYPLLCKLTFGVVVVENLALGLLTYVSSVDWFLVHKVGFSFFVICSVLHQVLHVVVCRFSVNKMEDLYEKRLIRRKTLIMGWHWLSLASAMYCYWRHNAFCEPGVYTFFALFEYFVVVSNMCFHYTFVWDFDGARLNVSNPPRVSQLKYSIA